jgi:hypothetical protein
MIAVCRTSGAPEISFRTLTQAFTAWAKFVTHLRRSGEAHSRRNGLAALKDGLYMTVTSREEKAGSSGKNRPRNDNLLFFGGEEGKSLRLKMRA